MHLVEQTFPEVKEWRLSTILQETTLCHFYEKMGYQKTGEIVWIQEEMALVFIEFAGEKTHYFNGGMIARRRTVRM